MSKHTPGPWIVLEQRHPYKDGSKSHIERGIYTQHIHPQLIDHFPIVCMSIGIGMDGEKDVSFVRIEEANARLIAAAPDLLEAAKLVLAWYEAEDDHSKADFNQRMVMCRESEDAIRAAIAKATGESK